MQLTDDFLDYCAESYRRFQNNETVWYTPLENTCFFSDGTWLAELYDRLQKVEKGVSKG